MIPENIAKLIGLAGDPVLMDVEAGAIKRVCNAMGETNPLYWDEEYARNSRYGSIIAPPGFFGWPKQWTGTMPVASETKNLLVEELGKAGLRVLDGGMEYDFIQPIRAGDTLVSITKITDVKERESKGGTMLFCTIEFSYRNQHGALVALSRQNLIGR